MWNQFKYNLVTHHHFSVNFENISSSMNRNLHPGIRIMLYFTAGMAEAQSTNK